MAELNETDLINDADLISYYRMEGNSNDSKGSNDGTDTSITYGADYGKYTQGASFNGSSSKIVLPALGAGVSGSSNRSIGGWIYVAGGSGFRTVYHSGVNATLQQFVIYINNSLQVYVKGNGRDWLGGTVPTNEWGHIVVTYNGGAWETSGNLKAYINGESVSLTSSGASTGSLNTGNSAYEWGHDPVEGTRYWNGYLDDMFVFDDVLTADEVLTLYTDLVPAVILRY